VRLEDCPAQHEHDTGILGCGNQSLWKEQELKKSDITAKVRQSVRRTREAERTRQDEAVDAYGVALAGRIMAEQSLKQAKSEASEKRSIAVRLGVSKDELKAAEDEASAIVSQLAGEHPAEEHQTDDTQPAGDTQSWEER
jgi:hypothetical protein